MLPQPSRLSSAERCPPPATHNLAEQCILAMSGPLGGGGSLPKGWTREALRTYSSDVAMFSKKQRRSLGHPVLFSPASLSADRTFAPLAKRAVGWVQEAEQAFGVLQEDAREVSRREQALRKKLKAAQRDLEEANQSLAKEAEKVGADFQGVCCVVISSFNAMAIAPAILGWKQVVSTP